MGHANHYQLSPVEYISSQNGSWLTLWYTLRLLHGCFNTALLRRSRRKTRVMRRSSRIRQKKGALVVKSIVTVDLSERQHGFNYIEASKHRSCWVHILAGKLFEGKKLRNGDSREIDIYKRISPCFCETVPRRGRSKRRVKTGPKGKLNTTTFDTYFRSMWDRYSEDKKASFAYLDCLWFSLYYDSASRQKVLLWIKKKAIFSKAYVIVPIVLWDHWNLLILCHFDQNIESSTRRPCMLLLDSLENAGPRRYETEIRKFVFDVFQAMGRPETKKMLSKIPFMVPKVPQQIDGKECGKFVLYFIHLFMNTSPEDSEAPNGYPNFMNEKWFDRGGYEDFCNQLITGL